VTETLLLDNSAWARLSDPALSGDRVSEIADALEAGRIASSLGSATTAFRPSICSLPRSPIATALGSWGDSP
jgi:hypothetical protein